MTMVPRWIQHTFGLLVLGAVLYWGWDVSQAWSNGTLFLPNPKGPAQLGKLVPRIRAQQQDGSTAYLRHFRGKWVLLNYWATWCEPCRREMGSLENLARTLKAPDFALWAVSVDANWKVVQSFFGKHPTLKAGNLTMKIALDTSGESARRYGTSKFPETYLIDPQGRLRQKWIGPFQWDKPAMVQQIRRLMGR
ncbi:MAG: TlpA family protein disulfide reductase [Deltaproteobacteria bacterium]|nr:MAG: TlpA family protein disulfide reductase [Deltaproteobacteria bacterium]